MLLLSSLVAMVLARPVRPSEMYPTPGFTDEARVQKLSTAFGEIDGTFRQFAESHKVPGMVWGIVIDGQLAHVAATGLRDRQIGAPVENNTIFRIASMTKSFTALAILKLRDEGKLSLEDPVSKWIPEFAHMPLPTHDTAPLIIRELLSHSAGFPEDNPWGDQQLAASDADLTQWLRDGIPFSTPPDTRYEYSNYAFALLGRIVTKASGMPYVRYEKTQILDRLGMTDSSFEFAQIPAERRAKGYRLKPDGTYAEERPLPDGAFGSMGGLLTSASDLGKYIGFQLDAWPARDDAERGPVRRSSVREMNHLWRPGNLTVRSAQGGQAEGTATGYGYGLRISSDCRFEQIVGHGGGLPGFGSYMLWLPDYGVGFFAMANLTYVGPAEPINGALDLLIKTGGLQRRQLPPSPMLTKMRGNVWNLWNNWDPKEAESWTAVNFFRDQPPAQRQHDIEALKRTVGACHAAGPVEPENWLRAQFNLQCENGTVGAFMTLAPTMPPKLQHLAFRKLTNADERMYAPTGAPAGVSCSGAK